MGAMAARPLPVCVTRTLSLLALAWLVSGCERSSERNAAPAPASEPLILATTPFAEAAPVFVALARGYLEREGFKVTVQSRPSGKAALDAVIAGSADVATVAELPVALAVARGYPITVFATLSTQSNYGVVGRQDRGVSTPASLKGKRIAVTAGTTGDFFLDALLVRQRLARADVEVIERKPDELVETLQRGEADAISTWEPYVSEARQRLGANGAVFLSEGVYESAFNLATTRAFAKARPEAVQKILRAMVSAQELLASDQAASEQIVAQALQKSVPQARQLMDRNRFALSLDQSLLVLMEDEARWAVKNKVVDAKVPPNFFHAVHVDGLSAVKPRSVTVIR